MKVDEIVRLMENVVGNEFQHVQEYKESEFTNTDKNQKELSNETEKLFEKLLEVVPEEYKHLVDDLLDVMLTEQRNYNGFYFKEGVMAGLTKLNFLNEVSKGIII